MRKSFLVALAVGAFALSGSAYAGTMTTSTQPTIQAAAPVPLTDAQMKKVVAGKDLTFSGQVGNSPFTCDISVTVGGGAPTGTATCSN